MGASRMSLGCVQGCEVPGKQRVISATHGIWPPLCHPKCCCLLGTLHLCWVCRPSGLQELMSSVWVGGPGAQHGALVLQECPCHAGWAAQLSPSPVWPETGQRVPGLALGTEDLLVCMD